MEKEFLQKFRTVITYLYLHIIRFLIIHKQENVKFDSRACVKANKQHKHKIQIVALSRL